MIWTREDAFIAKAGIKKGGGQCNQSKGWYGVMGNCQRKKIGKGGDRVGAQKEALKAQANKVRAERGMGIESTKDEKAARKKVESELLFLKRKEREAQGKLTPESFAERAAAEKKARQRRAKEGKQSFFEKMEAAKAAKAKGG